MNKLKHWIENHPVYTFLLLLPLSIFGLYKLFFYSIPFFQKPNTEPIYSQSYQDIGDLFGATIGNGVGLAGSVVAIILAMTAYRMAQSERRRALYETAKKDIGDSLENTLQFISIYKQARYAIYEIISEFTDLYIKLQSIEENVKNGAINAKEASIVKTNLKNVIDQLSKDKTGEVSLIFHTIADAFIDLESDYFLFDTYLNDFKSHETFKYCGYFNGKDEKKKFDPMLITNFYADPTKLIEMSMQIKKYADFLLNALVHISNKISVMNQVDQKTKKDLLVLITIGYCSGAAAPTADRHYLINTMVFLDMLYNIPDPSELKGNFIKHHNLSNADAELIDNLINNSALNKVEEFKKEISYFRDLVYNNFEEIFIS